jgi:hypothetical protein
LFPQDRIGDLRNDVPLETVATRSAPMGCGPNVNQGSPLSRNQTRPSDRGPPVAGLVQDDGMSGLLQAMVPAALGLLVAYRGAITRTGRLRHSIDANIELIGKLPDDPTRATLAAHNAVLIGTLVRREGRQFQPITPAGSSFGVNAALAVLALVGAVLIAVKVAGLYQPQPLEREDMWLGLGFYSAVAAVCARFAFRAHRKGHAR